MTNAARVGFSQMSLLLLRLPTYRMYRTCADAEASEQHFRRALGRMLKECGTSLLNTMEDRRQILSPEQQQKIEILVDQISAIFRRLDREGAICLVGESEDTISELEGIDTRLILLVEEALALVEELARGAASSRWFKEQARTLSRDLVAFSEAAEERNYLLGLGWESEFIRRRKEGLP